MLIGEKQTQNEEIKIAGRRVFARMNTLTTICRESIHKSAAILNLKLNRGKIHENIYWIYCYNLQ